MHVLEIVHGHNCHCLFVWHEIQMVALFLDEPISSNISIVKRLLESTVRPVEQRLVDYVLQ